MKVLVFVLPLFGHVFQVKNIVVELQQLGHQVTVVVPIDFASYFDEIAYSTVLISVPIRIPRVGSVLISVPEEALQLTQLIIRQIVSKTKHFSYDVVLHDSMAVWGHYIAKMRRLPSVSLSTFFHLHSKNWGFAKLKSDELWHNPLANLKLCWSYYGRIYKLYKMTGVIGPQILNFYSGSSDLQLSSYLAELAPSPISRKAVFIGLDVASQDWEAGFDDAWYTGTCVFVSVGSIHEPSNEKLKQWIEVLADKPYNVLIKTSHTADSLPSNIRLSTFVNQIEVLKKTSVFVTHGGWNGLLEAAAHSVPVIVMPVWSDNQQNAKVFTQKGAGLTLDYESPTNLPGALELILDNISRFRANMAAINTLNSQAGRAAKAAQLIQEFIESSSI